MHIQIVKQVGNMYMEIRTNRHQYMNNCVFRATSHPSLSQDDALDLKSFTNKVYHEAYERFVKWEAGNYSVECTSDSAVLARRHSATPEEVFRIEPGERCTCNIHKFLKINVFMNTILIVNFSLRDGIVAIKW